MNLRWGGAGIVLGVVAALLAFAPASWLAAAVTDATDQRLLLADARGTVWAGSAVAVLTGGPGSRDASALPGRLHWTLALDGAALGVRARQDCCIVDELRLRVVPGFGRLRVELLPRGGAAGPLGQWPASWLAGLGTPWNTIRPAGLLRLDSPGLSVERVQGRWLFGGQAVLLLDGLSSRMSTLDVLGSYRLSLSADPANGAVANLQLSTQSGALQLSGNGQWNAASLHFTGQASAAPGSEAVLGSLLNIIGRRQGPVSVISIG